MSTPNFPISETTNISTPTLRYAPPAATQRRPWIVVVCGFISTALAILFAKLLGRAMGMNILGFYLWYIVPAGAAVVGAVAGLGYKLAADKIRTRTRRGILLAMIVVQPMVYVLADYVEFRQQHLVYQRTLKPVGYLTYVDLSTRYTSFQNSSISGGPTLGLAGYLLRLLEIAGFTGGAIFIAKMGPVPLDECDMCKVPLRYRSLAVLPASMPHPRGESPSDPESTDAVADGEIVRAAVATSRSVMSLAAEGNLNAVRELIADLASQEINANELPRRIQFSLQECPKCGGGRLRTYLVAETTDDVNRQMLDEVHIHPSPVRL